jgi:hypothetical protein
MAEVEIARGIASDQSGSAVERYVLERPLKKDKQATLDFGAFQN